MPRRIITEEELREAAQEVLEYELAVFDSYNDYPEHVFQGKFRLNMAALIHEVKRGAVKAAKYSMGFTFYAKQCLAAVLILFTLSCIAMPETVLAGYHKLVEVIETVFEDYTEYRYRVNDDGGIEETFKPLKLGYLPEGMEEVNRVEYKYEQEILYKNLSDEYLIVHQKKMLENHTLTHTIDSENTNMETFEVDSENVIVFRKNGEIIFVLVNKDNRIVGQTNLNIEKILKVISGIEKEL